jgi:hypothetical protein
MIYQYMFKTLLLTYSKRTLKNKQGNLKIYIDNKTLKGFYD